MALGEMQLQVQNLCPFSHFPIGLDWGVSQADEGPRVLSLKPFK